MFDEKTKDKVDNIIGWWFIGGFIFGSTGSIVAGLIGIDSNIIVLIVMSTIVLPIFVALIWFFVFDKEYFDNPEYPIGKSSPI